MDHHCIVKRRVHIGSHHITGEAMYRYERGDDYNEVWNANNQCQFFRVRYAFFFTKKDKALTEKIINERKAFCKNCNYWWMIGGDDDCHY